jgi:hypothetical protein
MGLLDFGLKTQLGDLATLIKGTKLRQVFHLRCEESYAGQMDDNRMPDSRRMLSIIIHANILWNGFSDIFCANQIYESTKL